MRYLVQELGWEKFQKLALKERSIVEMTTSTKTASLFDIKAEEEEPTILKALGEKMSKLPMLSEQVFLDSEPYQRWLHGNVIPQKQLGYFTAFITLAAGDITANQLRTLAEAIRNFSLERSARNTPHQNLAIRYVMAAGLPELYSQLSSIGLANPGALTISSAVGCSGTTSCNLAITNSHRLAKEIEYKFLELGLDTDDSLRDTTIKISGCPNSCGQHEIATIGFFGGASRIGATMAPTYTMLFGGDSGEFSVLAKPIMRVPAKRVIDTIRKIIEIYKEESSLDGSLKEWINRILRGEGTGKVKNIENMKLLLSPVVQLLPVDKEPEMYRDYGNDIKFSAKTARGECAA
jgi:sulfite reductase (ferredoxin)